jgi:hypothetical protein
MAFKQLWSKTGGKAVAAMRPRQSVRSKAFAAKRSQQSGLSKAVSARRL